MTPNSGPERVIRQLWQGFFDQNSCCLRVCRRPDHQTMFLGTSATYGFNGVKYTLLSLFSLSRFLATPILVLVIKQRVWELQPRTTSMALNTSFPVCSRHTDPLVYRRSRLISLRNASTEIAISQSQPFYLHSIST